MAALGLKASDFIDDDTVEVWPDNWPAVEVFIAMGTQWRYGANGPTGMDYAAIREVRYSLGINRKDWPALFADVQLMERAALEELRKQDG